jgi:hypothetical protein
MELPGLTNCLMKLLLDRVGHEGVTNGSLEALLVLYTLSILCTPYRRPVISTGTGMRITNATMKEHINVKTYIKEQGGLNMVAGVRRWISGLTWDRITPTLYLR